MGSSSSNTISLELVMTIYRFARLFFSLGVLNAAVSHEFPSGICVTWHSSNCLGEDRALTSTEVRLTYSYRESGISKNTVGPILMENGVSNFRYNLEYEDIGNDAETREADYYFEQLEHGGGDCN